MDNNNNADISESEMQAATSRRDSVGTLHISVRDCGEMAQRERAREVADRIDQDFLRLVRNALSNPSVRFGCSLNCGVLGFWVSGGTVDAVG